MVVANDARACMGSLQNGESMWGNLVLVERGDCMFVEKAIIAQILVGTHAKMAVCAKYAERLVSERHAKLCCGC